MRTDKLTKSMLTKSPDVNFFAWRVYKPGSVIGDHFSGTAVADSLKQKMESGISVLGSVSRKKACLVAVVTADLVKKGYHAGEIIKMVARLVKGSGGGRADMAQAGGTDPAGLKKALDAVPGIVKELENLGKD